MSATFDRQIHELAVRTSAYHDKCECLWNDAPPPPHFGAKFLFAYLWSAWTPQQREALIETGRTAVKQSIAQMLATAGAQASDKRKMNLLLAACVPEIFQEELSQELKAMAVFLSNLWARPSKRERHVAAAQRPTHISSEMSFVDNMPIVWQPPTLQLIQHTLQLLDYQVFACAETIAPEHNKLYQQDLLLALRAFWLSYFGLQIFMQLSEQFAETEERLLRQDRIAMSESTRAHSQPQREFRKPLSSMKIEEIVECASEVQQEDQQTIEREREQERRKQQLRMEQERKLKEADRVAAATSSASSTAAPSLSPSLSSPPPNLPPSAYCARCHRTATDSGLCVT